MKQIPSIGRIVHYVLSARESATNAGVARPAIITRVSANGECGLTVFPDCHHDQASATIYVKSAPFDESAEGNKPGTWKWPPYVAPQGKSTTFEPKKESPRFEASNVIPAADHSADYKLEDTGEIPFSEDEQK